jgi:hypothetical protein
MDQGRLWRMCCFILSYRLSAMFRTLYLRHTHIRHLVPGVETCNNLSSKHHVITHASIGPLSCRPLVSTGAGTCIEGAFDTLSSGRSNWLGTWGFHTLSLGRSNWLLVGATVRFDVPCVTTHEFLIHRRVIVWRLSFFQKPGGSVPSFSSCSRVHAWCPRTSIISDDRACSLSAMSGSSCKALVILCSTISLSHIAMVDQLSLNDLEPPSPSRAGPNTHIHTNPALTNHVHGPSRVSNLTRLIGTYRPL